MKSLALPRRSLLTGLAATAALPALTAAAARNPRALIKTDHGDFLVELETGRAPITAANFLRYVDAAKYDGGSFFRATHPKGARDQGTIVGAPPARDHPFPPIRHESTTTTGLRHVAGAVSVGRFEPGSARGNIFVCVSAIPAFDADPQAKGDNQGYAVFGHVTPATLPVVRRIHRLPTDGPSPYPDQKGEWLNPAVRILSVRRAA